MPIGELCGKQPMHRRYHLPVVIAIAVVAVACAAPTGPTIEETALPPETTATVIVQPASLRASPTPSTRLDSVPERLSRAWPDTDFSKHSVPFFEIISGGVGRTGIPPIDSPLFLQVSAGPQYMDDADPVIALEIQGQTKAYPLDILQGHEIVNDTLNDVPVAVTYCPLCNTAIVFKRQLSGRTLDFGVSGMLRNSDLLMWDRQTESWWQQITGESIVGEMTGTKMEIIPAPIVSWKDYREAFPDGLLLSRETGITRNYDDAPYDGYDNPDGSTIPFLYLTELDREGIRGGEQIRNVVTRKIDDRLSPMERVLSVKLGDQAVAYPFTALRTNPVINDSIDGQAIVVFFTSGTSSAFQGSGGSANRLVGATGVYIPEVDGEKLVFKMERGKIVDETTGSTWSILGKATEGPLVGEKLQPVAHANHFWFAWVAFNPTTEIRGTGR